MTFLRDGHDGNWVITNFAKTDGITAVQWDGGPTYSIHGNSIRRLPDLDLNKLYVNPGTGPPALLIELLADGYRKVIMFLVNFTVDGQPKFRVEGWGTDPEWK